MYADQHRVSSLNKSSHAGFRNSNPIIRGRPNRIVSASLNAREPHTNAKIEQRDGRISQPYLSDIQPTQISQKRWCSQVRDYWSRKIRVSTWYLCSAVLTTSSPRTLILAAKTHPEVIILAVSARDRKKAEAYAKKYGIPEVKNSYQGKFQVLKFSNFSSLIIMRCAQRPEYRLCFHPTTQRTALWVGRPRYTRR